MDAAFCRILNFVTASHNREMKLTIALVSLITLMAADARSQTPIKDVLAQIDTATAKAKDTTKEYSVSGVVAARVVLPNGKRLAFLHTPGEPALAIVVDPEDGARLSPRNEVKLAGKLG